MQPADLEYIEVIKESLGYLLPEIILCVAIVLLLIASFFTSNTRVFHATSAATIVVHIAIAFYGLFRIGGGTFVAHALGATVVSSSDIFATDYLSYFFKFIISFGALLTIVMSRKQKVEYYILILAILLGADLLVMGAHFIVILLAIELISISSYVLVAGSDPGKGRAEAAWKFFLFGSAATATMIFGMSYLFGVSATMTLPGHFMSGDAVIITIGGLMTLAGLFFKMTAAPFHLWAPDVYQSTPSPVVAYLSVVPKFAGLVVVIRFVGSFPVQPLDWTTVIGGFAILSIVVGTLAALAQKDAKRMMAYSTVAQTGFLLTGVSSFMFGSGDSIYAVGFYALTFLVMNYVVFMVIQQREENGGTALYESFGGLGYSNIIPAVTITIAFVSLAGLPPVAGFTAKLLVFSTLWAKYAATGSFVFIALFVVGLVATVASLFFYLKIPFYVFFRQSVQKEPLKIGRSTNLLLVILVGLLFALFFFPSLFDGLGGWVIKVNFVP